MTWNTKPFVAFDLETTGPDPETARIVSAAVLRFDPATGTVDVRAWLVNPGIPIPAEATAVHGITDERVRADGRDPAEAVSEIVGALLSDRGPEGFVAPVVAYNAAYDLTVLHRETLRHAPADTEALWAFAEPVIDPRVIDKQKDRYRKGKRTLTDVCAHYGVELTDAHSAAADAMAAGNLALALAEKYPELTKVDTAYLHERQAVWYADQAKGLAQYWRDTAVSLAGVEGESPVTKDLRERAANINTHWPIIPVKEAL